MDLYLKNFVPNLRCPFTMSSLREMDPQELNTLNESIKRKEVFTQEGIFQSETVTEALISSDKNYIYPVLNGNIAALLPDRAILAKGIELISKKEPADGKKKVRDFYDEYGWQKSDDSSYKDTVTFEDRRPVSKDYWSGCHMRLNKYLDGGEYLLDVASGAIPNDEYLSYSEKYKLRICMDFSIVALKEAYMRLGGKGIFILGDMTSIPIADNCIDSVISMHTVYHIPKDEQIKAVAESFRVLKQEGKAVIVYSWKDPALMQLAFKIWKPFLRLYKGLKQKAGKSENPTPALRPELFVQQQNYHWFANNIKKQFNAKLVVYSAISRSFSNTFLREKAFGKK